MSETTLASMPQTTLASTAVRAHFDRYLEVEDRIEGWFSREAAATWDALLSLQERCSVAGNMLEIGVWRGKSAAMLAIHADPRREKLMLLDKYLTPNELRENLGLVRGPLDDSIQFIQGDSRRLAVDPLIAEGFESFRWIHIDGEHSAGAVTNDLLIAQTLCAPNGIVCLDDFFNWMYPQVTEAVLRYVRENPDHFALFLCGYNKAYLARPHYVHTLLDFCKVRLADELEARGVEATVAKTTWPAEMNTFGIGPRFEGKALRGPDWDQRTIRV